MKNFTRSNIIILAIFLVICSHSIAANRILPLPKPLVDKETKEKTAKKKEIYPQKKPKIEQDNILEENTEKIVSDEITKEEIFIYPENRPILVKKKIDKAVTKSTLISSKDFKIAKSAFEYVSKKKWQSALKVSKKSRDP